MSKTIKLVANLSFDENKEADIINMIEYLNSHHKTGQFLSGLIRLAMDCPEIITKSTNGEICFGANMGKVTVDGISTLRRDFLNGLSAKVDKLWDQVTDIRKMALQLNTLAQMNKFIGLEGKSENTLRASFVLEKQLSDLQKSLGVLVNDKQFIDTRLKSSKEFSEETLEYIINTYDGIVNEIKNQFNAVNSLTAQTVSMVQQETVQIETPVTTTKPVETVVKPVETVVEPVAPAPVVTEVPKPVETVVPKPVETAVPASTGDTEEDEVIDFGSDPDDLEALANFFGD